MGKICRVKTEIHRRLTEQLHDFIYLRNIISGLKKNVIKLQRYNKTNGIINSGRQMLIHTNLHLHKSQQLQC